MTQGVNQDNIYHADIQAIKQLYHLKQQSSNICQLARPMASVCAPQLAELQATNLLVTN